MPLADIYHCFWWPVMANCTLQLEMYTWSIMSPLCLKRYLKVILTDAYILNSERLVSTKLKPYETLRHSSLIFTILQYYVMIDSVYLLHIQWYLHTCTFNNDNSTLYCDVIYIGVFVSKTICLHNSDIVWRHLFITLTICLHTCNNDIGMKCLSRGQSPCSVLIVTVWSCI